jgi:hypothetical protein
VSRIVCNSGPLIALGILNRFDLLKELFGEVLVPDHRTGQYRTRGSAALLQSKKDSATEIIGKVTDP